jgi:hypothetical protein
VKISQAEDQIWAILTGRMLLKNQLALHNEARKLSFCIFLFLCITFIIFGTRGFDLFLTLGGAKEESPETSSGPLQNNKVSFIILTKKTLGPT